MQIERKGCEGMHRCFNIDGACYPDENYMVNIDGRLEEIKSLIDHRKYFVMNKARQYGKTTMIGMLSMKLKDTYKVFSISFEGLSDSAYEGESAFCRRLCGLLYDTMYYGEVEGIPEAIRKTCQRMSEDEQYKIDFRVLSNFFSMLCEEIKRPVVLIIDEVDQAANQELFISFLGMMRDKYLKRRNRPTFQSVILVGVYDIKNLKLKIRKDLEHQYNSPWNIAAKFSIDMSFSKEDISGMLAEYEEERNVGMDLWKMSELIYEYTAGYPYLVSYICKAIDEQIMGAGMFKEKGTAWSKAGVTEAVRILLREPNTLFDDMIKHLNEYPELSRMLQNILFDGQDYPYNPYNHPISIGSMFGFIAEKEEKVCVANRIFETHMYNYFISETISANDDKRLVPPDGNQFVKDGFLDMELVLEKFLEYYTEICQDDDESFLEENARKLFLLYLKPIINGTGNYYVEAQTRNRRRTDIIVDYLGRQYIIEMKIYHGEEYNRKGEEQLADYLELYRQEKGYLLSFNFNKKKKTGIVEKECHGKRIFEVVV